MPLIKRNSFLLLQKFLFILVAALILLSPWFISPEALASGLVFGLVIGNPFQSISEKASKYVLQAAVVGLGFGIDLYQVIDTGVSGLMYTAISLCATMLLGLWLGKLFGISPKLTHLISTGTAICGGSAIAAVAPAIKANAQDISVSLAVVFILNAVALFVFPVVGHVLGLSQQQFGIWAAIAIHDTSSVVGAAGRYGNEALHLATTLKLTRALWIIPMVIASSIFFKAGGAKVQVPLFIVFFILASVLVTFVPPALAIAPPILFIAKRGLLLSLFLIGANLNRTTLRSISAKPFYQGLILWLLIAVGSLAAVIIL